MPLADGYIDLPPGKLANVVTCLEMRAPAAARPEPDLPGASIERFDEPDLERWRGLMRRVGAPYLWQSPMLLGEEEFKAIAADPNVETYFLRFNGADEGILQLDFSDGEAEIRYFGLTDAVRGTGAGRKLMNFALRAAWSRPIRRLWLHTCSHDHPHALPFYIRSGFVPYKRQIEIHDDPRVIGLYPKTAAPNVPII